MLLYITGGVGFGLSILAILLIVLLHKKGKSKLIPIILYCLGFILFIGSGFLHWRGFVFDLPGKEPAEDVQPAEDGADAPAASDSADAADE